VGNFCLGLQITTVISDEQARRWEVNASFAYAPGRAIFGCVALFGMTPSMMCASGSKAGGEEALARIQKEFF
jgi:hypothetical protein